MKIQLKHSNVFEGASAKEPTAEQMEYGELAVNYNNNDPAIFVKDSRDKIIRIAGRQALDGIQIPNEGGADHQPNTLDQRYVEVRGDNMSGNLTLGINKITLESANGNGTFAGTVTAKEFLGDGSNLTGIIKGDTLPIASVSERGIVQLSNSTSSNSEALAATPKAAKSAYDRGVAAEAVANTKLPLTGGTVTGNVTVNGTFQAGHFNLANLGELV